MTRSAITRFIACESGATAVEYAVMATFIMIALVAVLTKLSTNMSAAYNKLSSNLT